jgi:selenocysteine lyase/cysteine desulfurase
MSTSTPQTTVFSPNSTELLTENPWEWLRQQMPVTKRWVYFDHAAVAPLPEPACRRSQRFVQEASEQGDTCWLQWAAEIEELRSGIANWLRATPEEIALIPNTTFGVNLVAEGWQWRPGDNIVVPEGEFPSNHFPWQNQQRKGVELRVVPSPMGRIDLDGIRRAIDSRTRMVAASWVGYLSGYRVPLADLCQMAHERGAFFFLDAIQGLGAFPLDLGEIPIDFLAADGHKWMLGPEGAGFAFIRKCHLERLECSVVGWNSVVGRQHFSASAMELRDSAARFEGGSYNMNGLLTLFASLQLLWQISSVHGHDAIANRILSLHAFARERLRAAGFKLWSDWSRSQRSGIITLSLANESPQTARERLLNLGIVTSRRGDGLRFSPHAYNTEEELERAIEVLQNR